MAPFVDHRFDCRDLLQRGVIHYESERKASSAIIFAPIQGVTSGTVASVSRGPSEEYRAKAAEFRAFLTNTPRSPNEMREFRDLEQTYTTLAENEEWMAIHLDKTIQRRKNSENRTALAEEEEQILKCLGAAVLMRWNTVPTKLQRELFDCASSIGDLQQTTPLKGRVARFLHNHKNNQSD
jgi:hypothetical protein